MRRPKIDPQAISEKRGLAGLERLAQAIAIANLRWRTRDAMAPTMAPLRADARACWRIFVGESLPLKTGAMQDE